MHVVRHQGQQVHRVDRGQRPRGQLPAWGQAAVRLLGGRHPPGHHHRPGRQRCVGGWARRRPATHDEQSRPVAEPQDADHPRPLAVPATGRAARHQQRVGWVVRAAGRDPTPHRLVRELAGGRRDRLGRHRSRVVRVREERLGARQLPEPQQHEGHHQHECGAGQRDPPRGQQPAHHLAYPPPPGAQASDDRGPVHVVRPDDSGREARRDERGCCAVRLFLAGLDQQPAARASASVARRR